MPTSIIPNIYDETVADENIEIATEDAYAMLKRLAREEGLLVGISAAAAMAGSLRLAKTAEPGSVIVTIFPDAADRYLSERLWDDL